MKRRTSPSLRFGAFSQSLRCIGLPKLLAIIPSAVILSFLLLISHLKLKAFVEEYGMPQIVHTVQPSELPANPEYRPTSISLNNYLAEHGQSSLHNHCVFPPPPY